jgi:hypothetical protein
VRLILHIGLHKTGSTSLQLALARTNGPYLYPQTGRDAKAVHAFGQHLLPQALKEEDGSPLWDELLREIQGADLTILSSELFHLLGDAEVDGVARYIPSAEVVMYLRRQDLFLQSIYGMNVLYTGETRELRDYPLEPEIDYHRVYRRWARHFPVTAIPFERASLAGGDVIADFSHRIGVPLAPQPRANRSYPRTVIDLARQLTLAGGRDLDRHNLLLVASFVFAEDGARNDLLSPDEARAFYARYAQSNAALARDLGRERLFLDEALGDQAAWEGRYGRGTPPLARFLRDAAVKLKRQGLLQGGELTPWR